MRENTERIIKKTCTLFGVNKEDLLGKSRKAPLPLARSIVAKTIRDMYCFSYPKIGKIIKKNHASVVYYLKMYDAEYRYNQEFRNFANALKESVLDIRTDFQEELEDELNEIIG